MQTDLFPLLTQTDLEFDLKETQELFSRIKEVCPKHFHFYHLGEVRLCPILQNRDRSHDQILMYQLTGEKSGAFILSIPSDLDLSIYLEMGNIILGKLTTALTNSMGLDLMFSPPQVISSKQSALLSDLMQKKGIDMSYDFLNQTQGETFDAFLRFSRTVEIGNA
ncbi:hypothetical protein EBS43_11820 [bacterium]|nr:hypothetical protein [bacterium]